MTDEERELLVTDEQKMAFIQKYLNEEELNSLKNSGIEHVLDLAQARAYKVLNMVKANGV